MTIGSVSAVTRSERTIRFRRPETHATNMRRFAPANIAADTIGNQCSVKVPDGRDRVMASNMKNGQQTAIDKVAARSIAVSRVGPVVLMSGNTHSE